VTGVELALLDGPKDAREHGMGLGTGFGSVAPADLTSDDGWAQGLLGPPVGGVDRIGFEEKRKDGWEFDGQMRGEAPRDA
jgi:hypothetical protein